MPFPRLSTSASFAVASPVLVGHALLTLVLSIVLLLLSRQRGAEEFGLWALAYLAVAIASIWKPHWAPLVGGSMAFLLGIVKTHCAGPNLDLGLCLLALSVALFQLDRLRREAPSVAVDPAGLALLALGVWALISLGFALPRIRGFTPAPGFDYHVYPFNPLGLTSDEAIIRAVTGATMILSWLGLYEFGRTVRISPAVLRGLITGLLVVNGVVLFVQRNVDPYFLLHAGRPIGRLNGVTSYCYSLGDAVLAFFLLLPVWGALRGAGGLMTALGLGLVGHAVAASGSRTALLVGLIVGVGWLGRRVLQQPAPRRRMVAGLGLGALAVVLSLAAWAYRATPPNDVSLLGRLKLGVERDGVIGHLVVTRLSSYPLIGRVIAAYPLSGVGAGLYVAEVSKQHALLAPEVTIQDPFLLSSFAPNQFLNSAVELGLPALLALVVVFAWAGRRVLSRRGPGRAWDLALGVLALAVALQAGPSLYTSEAAVFFWLLIGMASRWAPWPGEPVATSRRLSTLLLVGAATLGLVGQVAAVPSLAVEAQWRQLRWPMNLGLRRPSEGGRWTGPEATFTVDTNAPQLPVDWHVGDTEAPGYRARVSFYVDGVVVERHVVGSGPVRQSVLPLPDVAGLKRISVRVEPPFLPGEALGRNDPRRLGIFIHGSGPTPWQPPATGSAGR